MKLNKAAPWLIWALGSIALAIYLGYPLMQDGGDKSMYLIGETSYGHHQIEMSCSACHTEPFGGGAVLQDACVECHGEQLEAGDDSHPKSKFTDPRNADRVAQLDARLCVTCHREHKAEITGAMGVTLPADFCYLCHQDIAEDRPSHAGMEFDTCASAGCHNFHDNLALYEDFLVKHAGEPPLLATAAVPDRNLRAVMERTHAYPAAPLTLEQISSNGRSQFSAKIGHDWESTAHAAAGVECDDCHMVENEDTQTPHWVENPDHKQCQSCHGREVDGFLAGHHGMRLQQELAPMDPAQARLPMKDEARGRELSCNSCHSSHRFDTTQAAVEACIGCHDDQHTRAYKDSPHYRLWLEAQTDSAAKPGGASCATCHLPREEHGAGGVTQIRVQHNQSLNLRPNEKMLRSVCMNCHGLGFALDALADPKLIESNFSAPPGRHIESIEMAVGRVTTSTPTP